MNRSNFRLKALKPSRISEISEITAASGISAEEQIAFHIGNPVRDEKLTSEFTALVLGDTVSGSRADFIRQSIADAVYYAPRGGYRNHKQPAAVRLFLQWLYQQSPAIHYHAGTDGDPRELTLITGGIKEALRLFLFVLENFLENHPMPLLAYKLNIPQAEQTSILQIRSIDRIDRHTLPSGPSFLLLGENPASAARQTIAEHASKQPLYCVEFHGAGNNQSLAREAVLAHQTLRFFPAETLCATCRDLSLVFALGEAELIQYIEAVHFRLKGTPAATEIALFEYRMQAAEKRQVSGNNFQPYDHSISSFLEKALDAESLKSLEKQFLSNWLQHQPQYDPEHVMHLSGSARTALALLGFELGFRKAVISDFSWNYEDCFPEIVTAPLLPNMQPDVKKCVSLSLSQSLPLLVNSPHNATGAILSEKEQAYILQKLLPQKIFVIDDLSYQNLWPHKELPQQPTLKIVARRLIRQGLLIEKDLDYLITVHSLSKTDCFAGGRICIVEIRHSQIKRSFAEAAARIKPHALSLLIAARFYHHSPLRIAEWYARRNQILAARMQALFEAAASFSDRENPYQIRIIVPEGAMYPRLEIGKMPDALEPNLIADGLASSGIGLIPFSNFSRTREGIRSGRNLFRLTLGGDDSPEKFFRKGRRLIEKLTRLLEEEEAKFRIYKLPPLPSSTTRFRARHQLWPAWEQSISQASIVAASSSESSRITEAAKGEKLKMV